MTRSSGVRLGPYEIVGPARRRRPRLRSKGTRRSRSRSLVEIAEVYAVIGESTRALEWLDRAIRAGDDRGSWFDRDPQLTAIRAHADFRTMLDSVAFRRRQRAPAELNSSERSSGSRAR